jgi:hypothetical protein
LLPPLRGFAMTEYFFQRKFHNEPLIIISSQTTLYYPET